MLLVNNTQLQINSHTSVYVQTQLLCPAIVLQRKPVRGGGQIWSEAEGADGEKTPGWKRGGRDEEEEEEDGEKGEARKIPTELWECGISR